MVLAQDHKTSRPNGFGRFSCVTGLIISPGNNVSVFDIFPVYIGGIFTKEDKVFLLLKEIENEM